MPGSCVARTPGAVVMRGGGVPRPVRVGAGVALGAGVRSATCDSAGG